MLGGIAPKANKMEQAKRLLRELAETNNAMQSNEIFNLADEQGISKRTLENANNFCNLAIFKNAIPRLQNSNILHCCAVALPVRHCLILSSYKGCGAD